MLREELHKLLTTHQQALEARLSSFSQAQNDQLNAMRKEASDGRAKLEEGLKVSTMLLHTRRRQGSGKQPSDERTSMNAWRRHTTCARASAKSGSVAGKIQALTESKWQKEGRHSRGADGRPRSTSKENEAKRGTDARHREINSRDARSSPGRTFKLAATGLNCTQGHRQMQYLATGVVISARGSPTSISGGGWAKSARKCRRHAARAI